MVESPCKSVCRLYDGVCAGCHRTVDEIVGWYDMSDEDKQKIVDRINELQTTFTVDDLNLLIRSIIYDPNTYQQRLIVGEYTDNYSLQLQTPKLIK